MHLYYARFFSHFFFNMGWIAQREPFKNLLTQGMIKGRTFSNPKTGEFVKSSDVDFSGDLLNNALHVCCDVSGVLFDRHDCAIVECLRLLGVVGKPC